MVELADEKLSSILTAIQESVTAENAGERLQTRCERETLSRFPRTGAILFTIRTHMRRLKELEGRPDKVTFKRCPAHGSCFSSSAWVLCLLSPLLKGLTILKLTIVLDVTPSSQAKELAHALRNLPQELKNYKTIAAFQNQALEYLDNISSPKQAQIPEPALR